MDWPCLMPELVEDISGWLLALDVAEYPLPRRVQAYVSSSSATGPPRLCVSSTRSRAPSPISRQSPSGSHPAVRRGPSPVVVHRHRRSFCDQCAAGLHLHHQARGGVYGTTVFRDFAVAEGGRRRTADGSHRHSKCRVCRVPYLRHMANVFF